jgi:hypothetical protein
MVYAMSRLWKISALLAAIGCVHAEPAPVVQAESAVMAHYTVTIFDNFEGARVRACFDGTAVRELVPIDSAAAGAVRKAWADGRDVYIDAGRIRLSDPLRSSCVTYETRFRGLLFRAPDSSAVVMSQAQWLWRPEPFPRQQIAAVRFILPDGGRVSLPWPKSGDTYYPDESAFFMRGYNVLGSFDHQVFSVDGTSVEVARIGSGVNHAEVQRWLGEAMRVSASVGESFPRDRLHFVVVFVDPGHEFAGFGMLRRGGGASVLLVPSLDATVEQLQASWVAIHELAHLWLPRVYSKDRWLSEGIATYLQEVLRARCGLQSSARAWTRLREGFERGRRSGTGRRLARESREMNQTGAYHRVYWAGAAFALEVDVRLRRESNGEMNLLRALDLAQGEWAAQTQPVGASKVLAELEEASGVAFLEALAQTYAVRSEFPRNLYLDAPEYASLREQITSPAKSGCSISAGSSR